MSISKAIQKKKGNRPARSSQHFFIPPGHRTKGIGAATYQPLLQARPWYSRYGGDLFSATTYATSLNSSTVSSMGMGIQSHLLGKRPYELVNHLGNVQATVLDRATPFFANSQVAGYKADVSTAQDYYPFGLLHTGRNWVEVALPLGGLGVDVVGVMLEVEVMGKGEIDGELRWYP